MDCAKAKQYLSEYVDGCLSEELSAQLQVHLASCAQCRAQLKSYEKLRAELCAFKLENTDDFVWKGIANAQPTVLPLYKKAWVRSLSAVATCFVLVIGLLAVTQNGAFKPTQNGNVPETVQEDSIVQPDASAPMKARTADVPYADQHFHIPEGGVTTFGSAEVKQKNAAMEETLEIQSYSYCVDDMQTDKNELMPENEKASAGGGVAKTYPMQIVTFSVSAQAREIFLQTLSALRVEGVDEPTLIEASDLEKLLQIDGVKVTQERQEVTTSKIREGRIVIEY